EVPPRLAQYHRHAAGHVFASVVARSLDHRRRSAVAHAEALAGAAGGKQASGGGAVEHSVPHDGVLVAQEAAAFGRPDNDLAPAHSLAHVVVGLAVEDHAQAAREESAKALSGASGEAELRRIRLPLAR